jgi:anti-sigma28 factor (negative regulator of flagellin synthesis)
MVEWKYSLTIQTNQVWATKPLLNVICGRVKMDRMDLILDRLSQRITEWEGASREAIEAETNFKSFEASSQKAHMDAGASAAKAQTETRSSGEWANHYRTVQQASLKAETLKKKIMLGQLAFDAERTKQANQRRIV